jgi:hypothetical protein
LDYILPDMKGNEVSQKLCEDAATAKIPVVYMSGFGSDLRLDPTTNPNVIGSLNKPFTSDLLIRTVETHMPKSPEEPPSAPEAEAEGAKLTEPVLASPEETGAPQPQAEEQPAPQAQEWWSPPPAHETWGEPASFPPADVDQEPVTSFAPADAPAQVAPAVAEADLPNESVTGGAYFCGDTRFFSLNWALQTIAKAKLTGALRSFWNKEAVELLAKNGEILLATSRDPELYCSEAPITLVNVDPERVAEARARQRETGCPLFTTLAQGGHILQEPAAQLVQHYGQKLFSLLWTAPRVRFMFEQSDDVPEYAREIAPEPDVDHWALATLRLVQFPDLGDKSNYDPGFIPAYTRDGFERVQNLRLTVAEAQFASQFNGSRSIQQIAKNLRLDLKFARLTLFRFIALEIVELWSPATGAKTERKGVLSRFSRSIGMGE